MIPPGCRREREVARAVLAEAWPEELRAHARACAHCGEVTAVAEWLRGLAREEDLGPLPDADAVWLRARLARRVERRRGLVHRALRPITIWERITAGVAVVAVPAWVVLRWSQLAVWLEGVPTGLLARPEGLLAFAAAALVSAGVVFAIAVDRIARV